MLPVDDCVETTGLIFEGKTGYLVAGRGGGLAQAEEKVALRRTSPNLRHKTANLVLSIVKTKSPCGSERINDIRSLWLKTET